MQNIEGSPFSTECGSPPWSKILNKGTPVLLICYWICIRKSARHIQENRWRNYDFQVLFNWMWISALIQNSQQRYPSAIDLLLDLYSKIRSTDSRKSVTKIRFSSAAIARVGASDQNNHILQYRAPAPRGWFFAAAKQRLLIQHFPLPTVKF